MSDNDYGMAALAGLILFIMGSIAVLGITHTVAYDRGENQGIKDTVIECVTKPTNCKTRYDYIMLENKK